MIIIIVSSISFKSIRTIYKVKVNEENLYKFLFEQIKKFDRFTSVIGG